MANKQKILIVDDDENIANLISLYLTKECFDTMTVHDGQAALTAFKDYNPNLVLLDIMLWRGFHSRCSDRFYWASVQKHDRSLLQSCRCSADSCSG